MAATKVLFGFHAVSVRLRVAADSIVEVYVDASRRDARMRQFLDQLHEAGVRVVPADGPRIAKIAGSLAHQGVVARVAELARTRPLDELLDALDSASPPHPALLLALDGVTDPHNLGACLRVADGAGAHAVIAPKDRAAGLGATAAKVASGAAETVPYLMVTNLARTLAELRGRGIQVVGTCGDAPRDLYQIDFSAPTALVLGSEGQGLRQLTRRHCDVLVRIPMQGALSSLNVATASAVALYEALRQRLARAADAPAP